jgi:hypothetical protein
MSDRGSKQKQCGDGSAGDKACGYSNQLFGDDKDDEGRERKQDSHRDSISAGQMLLRCPPLCAFERLGSGVSEN